MSRTKGSKNKAKGIGPLSMSNSNSGNPAFNISEVEPSHTLGSVVAPGAVLPEDLELDRTLASMTAALPVLDDSDPTAGVVRKEVDKREMLGDVVADYKPASTFAELQEQVAIAVSEGCDSIEATLETCRKVCRDPALEKCGYFMYHGIKVYLIGAFERARARDKMTIEQKIFGQSDELARQKEIKAQIVKLQEQLNEH